MRQAATHVIAGTPVVELHEHRVDDEHRILRYPGRGLHTEQEVFERARSKARETCIHAGRIVFQNRDIRCW